MDIIGDKFCLGIAENAYSVDCQLKIIIEYFAFNKQ